MIGLSLNLRGIFLQESRGAKACKQLVDLEHDRGALHRGRRQIGNRGGGRHHAGRAGGAGRADLTLRPGGADGANLTLRSGRAGR